MPRIINTINTVNHTKELCLELHSGKCIGLPTETVYGLAADATNGEAVARIFEMKGRPKFNPLICHVSDFEMAENYGEFSPLAKKIAEAFWPGPLTLVLPLKAQSPAHSLVTAELGSIGLRCPQGPARAVIAEFGKPLAAPSANRSGRISPTTAEHVQQEFADTDLVILDNGPCEVGLESTIVKVTGDQLHLLRPGSVTAEMIFAETGVQPVAATGGKIEAPGMMKSHYAPNAKVRLNCVDIDDGNIGLLAFGAALETERPIFNLSEEASLVEAAANLYAGLKYLDDQSVAIICVQPIPNVDLGIAINDRLHRAAAPRNG